MGGVPCQGGTSGGSPGRHTFRRGGRSSSRPCILPLMAPSLPQSWANHFLSFPLFLLLSILPFPSCFRGGKVIPQGGRRSLRGEVAWYFSCGLGWLGAVVCLYVCGAVLDLREFVHLSLGCLGGGSLVAVQFRALAAYVYVYPLALLCLSLRFSRASWWFCKRGASMSEVGRAEDEEGRTPSQQGCPRSSERDLSVRPVS